jgi:MerR family transcriptional regulator/heat shock protein HspR
VSAVADETGVYVMSVAAELSGIQPSTLRLWESRGLLTPARSDGGTRLYSEDDLVRLRRIAELAADGVNLRGIRLVLELEDELHALRAGDGDG